MARQTFRSGESRWLKRIFQTMGVCLVFLAVVLTWLLAGSGGKGGDVRFTVGRDESTSRIAVLLASEGVIRSSLGFRLYARLTGEDRNLKAGNYTLAKGLSVPETINRLKSGGVSGITLTIPEGYTLEQIAQTVEDLGLGNKARFLELAAQGDIAAGLGFENGGLEGFLFPDTYLFSPQVNEEEIILTMMRRFDKVFNEEMRSKSVDLGLSIRQAVTLASLIQREAKIPGEMTRISGVLWNRLHSGMLLQVDATVLYALGEHKNRLTFSDLKVASKYNTYLYPGLPPGPISSPGEEALKAAIYPEKNSYYYYVADGTGDHLFAVTYKEHLSNISRIRSKPNP